jgi:uncharacterized protein (TIGR02594 family)
VPAPPTPAPTGAGPLWLQYAQAERDRWDSEIATWGKDKKAGSAEQYLDWDEQYFQASPYYGAKTHADGTIPGKQNMHWCAAFANWCLHRAGYSHTGSAGASSFLHRNLWRFDALTEPRQGCVIVTGNSKVEHVTFLWSWTKLPSNPKADVSSAKATGVKTLGGNQGNRVKQSNENRNLFAARGQNGITSPYFWPLRGEGTCSITSVATEQPHFCGKNPG